MQTTFKPSVCRALFFSLTVGVTVSAVLFFLSLALCIVEVIVPAVVLLYLSFLVFLLTPTLIPILICLTRMQVSYDGEVFIKQYRFLKVCVFSITCTVDRMQFEQKTVHTYSAEFGSSSSRVKYVTGMNDGRTHVLLNSLELWLYGIDTLPE